MQRTRSTGEARAECMEPRTLLAVFTVTTTADAGPGSLRQAILSANAAAGADTIRFNIPGTGVQRIAPQSPLPDVTGPTTIQGSTQPGYAGMPVIEVDGSAAGPSADGLVLRGASSRVEDLAINRFSRHGIAVYASSVLINNHVGINPAGDAARGNGGAGVYAAAAAILGLAGTPDSGNIISGNGYVGVLVDVPQSSNVVTLAGNYIGTDAAGATAIPNAYEGVLIENGRADLGVVVPGPVATWVGNVISGNGGSGVRVGSADGELRALANLIGTDATGARAVPNGTSPLSPYRDGITVLSPIRLSVVGPNNTVSGNVGNGVFIAGGSHPMVTGNRIGTDVAGTAAIPNGGHGVSFSSVSIGMVTGNTISGNRGDGVHIDAAGGEGAQYHLQSNRIGTDVAGASPLGNGGDGIEVIGRTNVVIGGTAVQSRNVISANRGAGVAIVQGGYSVDLGFDNDATVQGNYIGTDSTGAVDLGNGRDGVFVSGMVARDVRVIGNLVSGNDGNGVTLVGVTTVPSGTPEERRGRATVSGNYIGTDDGGTLPIANHGHGIEIQSNEGGVDVTAGENPPPLGSAVTQNAGRNVISGNAGHGVYVTGLIRRPGSRIEGNYIGIGATGAVALGNAGSGVFIDGGFGHQVRAGNVISANRGDGVTILGLPTFTGLPSAREVTVTSNRIGTDAQGSDTVSTLGNRGNGVGIYSSNGNSVGGAAPNDSAELGNTIAFNAGTGVLVRGTPRQAGPPSFGIDQNLIARNSIFSNGRLGIDLAVGPEGVTPNDPGDTDEGPNGLQNTPVLHEAATSATGTIVRYAYDGAPASIEFFGSPVADPSGFGEGKVYLGRVSTGPTVSALAQVRPVPAGWAITATAQRRDTSEFSNAVTATGAAPVVQVSGRRVFYNNSAFDNANPDANAADDGAVDSFKAALLPGGTATFANVTSYPRGINGVMIDVIGLPAGITLMPGDFVIRSGRSADPATFTAGPAPAQVTVRPFAGTAGGHRVTLVWPDANSGQPSGSGSAVVNGWLEITMKTGERTGLERADRFYFGNLVGETDAFNRAGTMQVNREDVSRILDGPDIVGVNNPFDINRDGRVNPADAAAVRSNAYRRLPLLAPPAATEVTSAAPHPRGAYAAARRATVLLEEAVPRV